MRKFYCSRIAIRKNFRFLYSSHRQFQQYVVDKAVKIQYITYIIFEITKLALRVESYRDVHEDLSKLGDTHRNQFETDKRVNIFKMVILLFIFTDFPRYLHKNYHDAILMVC